MTKRDSQLRRRWLERTKSRGWAHRPALRSQAWLALEPLEQRQMLNAAPVANAGGPYVIARNMPLSLDATLSRDPDLQTLTYAWDLDQDGQFDDATGNTPSVAWGTLVGLGISNGTHLISLRATDPLGAVGVATSTLTVSDQLSLVEDFDTVGLTGNPRFLTVVGDTLYYSASDFRFGTELARLKANGANVTPVRDIRTGGTSSNIANLTNVGALFFTANDGINGVELWKVDGDSAFKFEILPGSASSNPANLTNVGGILYFTADNGTDGVELWKSDGTSSGTALVKNIRLGASGSLPRNLTNVGGTLYFTADEGTNGEELWKSDGTSGGTVLVSDIRSGALASNAAQLTNVGGVLYFKANDGVHGDELWKSNGTSSGTVLVKDIQSGALSSGLVQLVSIGGRLYFTANDGASGYELWKSDGSSSGTELVKDIQPGPNGSLDPLQVQFEELGGSFYFAANDGTGGFELWKSDGTSSGTSLVMDLLPGAGSSLPAHLANVAGVLYFAANDGVSGAELWKSDGSSSGTVLVKDIIVGANGSRPSDLMNFAGTLFFRAFDTLNEDQLRRSDGTESGTVKIDDIWLRTIPDNLGALGKDVYFSANGAPSGIELWKTDGTSSGSVLVKDIQPGAGHSNPTYLTNVGGFLYFRANDGVHGDELWKTDGTSSGTVLVSDIVAGSGGSSLSYLTNFGGTLYFRANDGVHGDELWMSDGTSSGTVMVKDIQPGALSSNPVLLTNVGGVLFFRANDGTSGSEIWKSNGTSSGTEMVMDIRPGAANSEFIPLANIGGVLYFQANDGVHGVELWRSNGTASGTSLVRDIRPGANSGLSFVYKAINFNGSLYFWANDGVKGFELWKSDGTSSGTELVKEFRPGASGLSGNQMVNVNGTLYFKANNGTSGYELWKSDGTSAGSVMVKDIRPGSLGSLIDSPIMNVGGLLYFVANDGNGRELWKSDGTSDGTVRAALISPRRMTDITDVLVVGTRIYFTGTIISDKFFEYDATPVQAPYADPGGPYHIREGEELILSGAWQDFNWLDETLNYTWDIDGDGAFDDAGGAHPTLSWTDLVALGINDGAASHSIRLRIRNEQGDVFISDLVALTIANAAPVPAISGAQRVLVGLSYTYVLTASDPSPDDQAAGFTFRIDWDGDGIVDQEVIGLSGTTVSHTFDATGSTEVRVSAEDRDNAVSTNFVLSVTKLNATAAIAGPQEVQVNASNSYTLTVDPPLPAEAPADFTFHIDWNGDGIVDELVIGPSGTNVSHTFELPGQTQIRVSATYPDITPTPVVKLDVVISGVTIAPNVDDPGLNDLVWGGSIGADEVVFEQVDETTIRVHQTLHKGEIVDYDQTFSNVTGRVIALGNSGNDILNAAALSDTHATLDGGAGRNTLHGGQAGDILIGGSNGGEGKQGDNVIIAGNGTNTIYGNGVTGAEGSSGGNHLILGGSGSDTIYGSYANTVKSDGTPSDGGEGGQNLIVGGDGADHIYASQQADGAEGGRHSILIAGRTSGLNQAALVSILAEWMSATNLEDRIANISGTGTGLRSNGDNFLQVGVTVHDDAVTDELFSDTEGGVNWFFYAQAADTPHRLKPSDAVTFFD